MKIQSIRLVGSFTKDEQDRVKTRAIGYVSRRRIEGDVYITIIQGSEDYPTMMDVSSFDIDENGDKEWYDIFSDVVL